MILYIIKQSNQITLKRWIPDEEGNLREAEPSGTIGVDEIIVLQPYGSLFFAAAPVFEDLLPSVQDTTERSVVILRLRGRTDLGSTFMEVLRRYGEDLAQANSKLVLISGDDRILEQLAVSRVTDVVEPGDVYSSDEWLGKTVKIAHRDAQAWVAADPTTGGGASS